MTKRIISLLLVLVMVISMIPAQAVASGYQSALDHASDLEKMLEAFLTREEQPITAPEAVIPEQEAVEPAAVTTTPVPLGTDVFGGHTYFFYGSNSYTWAEVKDFCVSAGGYLAAIGSQEENDFLYRFMKSCGHGDAYFGLTDEEESRVWKWVNGEELVYTNWASGEPNSVNERHGMFYSGVAEGKWNDGIFSGGPFLLELEGDAPALEGVCGDGVFWSYGDGTLTISGQGVINDAAFKNHSGITSVVIGEGITAIGASAFQNCTALTQVSLPEGLVTIGEFAFSGCSVLTDISLPDTLTGISREVFDHCAALTEMNIPQSVLTIGYAAFRNCDGLSEITIPESVTSIDQMAFQDCTALAEVSLPAGLVTIGYNAFRNCDALTQITIPAGVTGDSGDYWFEDCDNLTAITLEEGMTAIPDSAFRNLKTDFTMTIPDTVTWIQNSAFRGCTGLTQIDLHDGIAVIDYDAFYDCTALKEAALPAGLTHLGDRVFYNCDALTKMEFSVGADCVLGSGIFENCDHLTEIRLGTGIQAIPDGMFRNMSEDFTVEIPDTVTRIGNEAFRGCTGLTQIRIPESVTQIGNHAYYGCSSLTEVMIPDSVTIMGSYAFAECKALHRVTLSKNWTDTTQYTTGTWGDPVYGGPFCNCTALTSVAIPEGAQSVARYAFQGCTALTDVQIPDSVTVIGGHSFRECTSLTGIDYPEALTEIAPHAFSGCVGLTEVEIPDTVEILGGCAFDGCVNLTQVKLPQNWEEVTAPRMTIFWYNPVYDDGPFANCTGLKSLTVPEGMTRLPDYAFQNSPALVDLRLPDSLTEIGKQALEGCTALTELQVSDAVTTVGSNAFARCEDLVVSCTMDSYILEYALTNNIQVNITDWTRPESDILDMDLTYYNTNTGDTNASGYIDLVVHYELKPEQLENLSDMKLEVLLQSKLVLMENSLRLDGEIPQGYSYKDNVLTVPVTEAGGTLRFSVNPESAARLFSRAEFVYTKDGVGDSDIIDCINSEMPVLTMVVPQTLNTETFTVSGVAPAESALTFFIDDSQAGTAAASKAGNYSAELTLPDVQEGKSYVVKVVAAAGETAVEKAMTVTYDLTTPVLEELLLYYSGHETGRYENYIVDLTDPHAGRTIITFNPTHDYIFRVKMSHPEHISCLYVTSTRNGQTKYIEAKYDENTGYFVTKDKFDNDVWNYVPGEIGVIYDRTYPELDRADLAGTADAMIDETLEELDMSAASAEIVESSETDVVVQTVLPSGDEVNYEYHQFTEAEAIAFLQQHGFVPEQEGTINPQSSASAELLWDIFEMAFDYVTFEEEEKDYYIHAAEDKMIVFSFAEAQHQDEVFMCWVLEKTGGKLIDLVSESEFKGGLAMDSVSAFYKFGTKMWALDLQKENATPEELKKIEKAENLLVGVCAARMTLAVMKVLLPMVFATVPGINLIVAVGAFFVEDYLDSVDEEGDWVRGFENSLIGSILTFPRLLREAFLLGVVNLILWIIDPSGYVYEAVTTNRLSGVTATVYYQDPDSGEAILWDAWEYDQINPIITGPDGSYAWDVPEGLWQVKYEMEGYETAYSEWMPVPPPQTDVNIGLVSYEVPETQWIDVYHDSVEIEFSKYMIPDTVDDIVLTDSRGNAIAYTLEYSTDETDADGTVYAREFAFEFESSFLNRGESCVITIPDGVQSYAGVSAEAETLTRVCTEEIVISAPGSVTIPYGEQAVISVSVSAGDFENIEVISMFAERAAVDAIEKTDSGWEITISGQLPGRTAVLITIPGTGVSRYVELIIDATDGAHIHDYTCETTKEATCTQDGSLTYICSICGESYVEKTPAFGHSFGAWIVLEEPTAAGEGREVRTCTVCGHTEERATARQDNPFHDVEDGSFYYDPVMWAIENGITNGTSATTFGPNDQCMRAHVVTFLWRAVGSPEPTRADNPFVDVKPTDFYYKPVLWALENGITSGMDATHFGPTSYCNRAQVVTFLYRTMGSPELEIMDNPFADVQAGAFYEKPVLWAVKNGITNGLSATSFGPNAICNRAQIVTFLYRAFVNG